MKNKVIFFLSVYITLILLINITLGQTNPTPQSLPYSQDFSSLPHTSTTYPSGWQGWTISTNPGSNFNIAAPIADRSLTASSTAATTSGNVHNYNGKIGFLNSSSLDLTIILSINTTGYTNIQIQYDIMTIRNPYDGSTNTRINEVTLQYRIGTTGLFTNLTGIEYQNNTTTQTGNTTSPQNLQTKTITLPSVCDNQSVVQLRWASRQVSGSGSRPSFAVDNVSINGSSISQNTYTWNAIGTASWTTATNWTPSRNNPSPSDILQFNNGGTVTVTNVPTQTIGKLLVTNSTIVNLQSGAANNILTITGGNETDLIVDAGSQLNINGTDSLTISLSTGTTGLVSGNMTFSNAAHRLTAVDANAITFQGGSTFTAETNFSGNAFGTTNLNSVVFANGSVYINKSGANPFGAQAPNSVVVFQSGSLYKHQSSQFPSFSGRTYANFEIDFPSFNNQAQTAGTSALTVDNLTITSATAVYLNLIGGINIKGNIYVAGGATLNFSPTSASNIILNGSSTQTIGGSGTINFGSNTTLVINNSNGIILNRNLTLGGSLTLTSGLLKLANNTLTVEGSINCTNPGINNMIVLDDGTNLGTLKRKVSANNIDYKFYIGDTRETSEYSEVILSFSGTEFSNAYISLQMSNVKHINNQSENNYLKRYWILEPSGTINNLSYTITLNYLDNDIVGNDEYIYFGKYNGISWENLGQADYTNNKLYKTALNSFSVFTGGTESAMPVKLLSFTHTTNGRDVKLAWITESELNNQGFEIHRKYQNNGADKWEKIGYINGKGTKSTITNYIFEDKKLQTGKYQYRLKQIDYNGNYEYFDLNSIVEIGIPTKFELSQNYPNPFNPITKIDFALPKDSKVNITLYDLLGREVKTIVNEFKNAGYYTILLDASEIPSGIYFYRMNTEENQFIMAKKMVILK
ncbi:MAG: T9SS type A sorting domain-containing protein [Ignavibacteria bacterium]|nr:T9SS type A sorting domain-containing protein [Ignavibacteria bacterium]